MFAKHIELQGADPPFFPKIHVANFPMDLVDNYPRMPLITQSRYHLAERKKHVAFLVRPHSVALPPNPEYYCRRLNLRRECMRTTTLLFPIPHFLPQLLRLDFGVHDDTPYHGGTLTATAYPYPYRSGVP
jgi:hypothetical protein